MVGRAAEARRVDAFLDAAATRASALLVEGEPGIGKTTLWKGAVDAAAGRGVRVLACRPTQPEASLAYAALGDLLGDLPDAALDGLPGPQRFAVDVALLRAEPEGEPPLPRAVALGLLAALRGVAAAGPVLIAVDDAQWLDEPSEFALAFAVRRLRDEPVAVLVSRRLEADSGAATLDDALGELPLDRMLVGALGRAELDALLRERLDLSLDGRTLARLHEQAAGNPFLALEVARALPAPGSPVAADLPLPPSVQELVASRLDALAPRTREAVDVAAALARPTAAHVEAALGADQAATALADAEAVGIVERDGERLRFAHPLFASVAYARIPAARRCALHERLAGALSDPEERAWHLALSAGGPDAEVAAALEDAALRARARGAPGAAAELWEQARRLTPEADSDEALRRGIEAAERRFEAGEVARADSLLTAIAGAGGPSRARALALLGWVRAQGGGYRAGAEVFAQALAEAGDDEALRIEIEEGLAWCVHSTDGLAAARPFAEQALARAEALGDPSALAGALSHLAFLESLTGEGVALERIERAVALGGGAPSWSPVLGRPDWIHALLLVWAGRTRASHEHFDALRADAAARGDEHSLPFILFQVARCELLLGDWPAADGHAAECRDLSAITGQAGERPYALTIVGLVDAHYGRVEAARAAIDEGIALGHEYGVGPAGLELLATRGFLELSLGNHAAAWDALAEVARGVDETGLREPALFRWQGDAIEAAVALGRTDEAAALVAELDGLGERLRRPWALTLAERGRALLAATAGRHDEARAALRRALELHGSLGEPFEHARTLLVQGTVERRDRQKAAARAALEDALARFEALGAACWAERTRAELGRVGGRAASGELTPTERRVAELIAAGHTYREAADALFISPKTVQWNLSKVYAKLGLRSRAELPGWLAAEEASEAEGERG